MISSSESALSIAYKNANCSPCQCELQRRTYRSLLRALGHTKQRKYVEKEKKITKFNIIDIPCSSTIRGIDVDGNFVVHIRAWNSGLLGL